MELQQYWQAVKKRVCMKCIDGDGYSNCLIDPSVDCSLELYFSKIVDVVNRVYSDNIDDYVDQLRANVCAECKYQGMSGSCVLRSEVECPLDRYFPLVVEAIEEVNQEAKA